MEEDIKILEKLSSIYQELKKDFKEGHASSYEMQFEDFTAIENLLKRYKNLEEENKHLKMFIDEEEEKIGELGNKNCELELMMEQDYIPKSSIYNLIKEIINTHSPEDDYAYSQIYLLNKLLEEKELKL